MNRKLIALCLFLGLSFPGASSQADGVLIFGGTGNTGSRIAKILAGQGQDVHVFVRPTSNRARLEGYDISFHVGDVNDPATVEAAFQAAEPETVVAVMQSRFGQPSPHGEPEINILRFAEQVGAKHYIYLSSVGAGPDTPGQRARYPDINFDRFAAGLALKGDVERALMASDIAWTIVRSGSILVEFGREPPPGTGRGYFTEDQDVTGAITYDDLAILMARCVGVQGCHGKVYHATDDTLGPEYNHWRCRRFATTGDLDAECDHLRPIDGFPAIPRSQP